MCEKKRDAKTYLQKIRLYDVQIDNKLEELARLRAMSTKVTSTLSGDVVSGSRSQDKLGNTVAKIMALEADVDRRVDALCDLKQTAMEIIDRLQNPNHIEVLHKRYFQYKSLEQISVDMGYSYRNVCYIHGKALQAMTALMNEMEVEFK
jgi:DNA-directed RNA polymerase specialized sigma subunit